MATKAKTAAVAAEEVVTEEVAVEAVEVAVEAVEVAAEVVELTAEEKLAQAQLAARAPVKVAEDDDPNMEMASILIPINPANKTDLHVTVGLNGRIWQIERGKTVQVPKALLKIMEHSQKADASALAYTMAHAE